MNGCSRTQTAGPERAVAVLLVSATLWGLSWWPLKQFAAQGLSGPLLALLSYGPVGLAGLYVLWRQCGAWRGDRAQLLLLALLGGWANIAFMAALMQGEVVRVMLLFYLSPVWSVLGGRLFLRERVGARRLLAVALALTGLWIVIGGNQALRVALSDTDWLALSSGLAFAGNNLVARATPGLPLASKTAAVFIGGALLAAAVMGLQGSPALTVPLLGPGLLLAVLLYGLVWLGLAMLTWQYGVTHLESGRAAVILVTELVVAVASAVVFGGEPLLPRMVLGVGLIGAAAWLEARGAGGSAGPRIATERIRR